MALTDITAQTGEVQDFVVEVPSAVYAGTLTDTVVEAGGSQYAITEVPAASGGGNIFIMSE